MPIPGGIKHQVGFTDDSLRMQTNIYANFFFFFNYNVLTIGKREQCIAQVEKENEVIPSSITLMVTMGTGSEA